ncbi:DUF4139 domain-containing protein [Mangrovibrevibacter kandeliae]|uniref:DUF4139 domain-containing protein n=1 Tax=Mangrovibrevibacter kandeliae TaxID=2968473 RepID=UPI002119952F|nr:DUF4139 domain-containing protein [Aurantimonas sp. CSK15Z-1]MCQ8783738.1 DUF4139 domain-containing protein [Aurantimonas sp. CSK15Z-1]
MRVRSLVLALLLVGTSPAALFAADGDIRSVTLSSGGLAEITRSQHVDGAGSVRLEVPLEQVDDILKSLVVRDPSGTVGSLVLPGREQAEETFRKLPFGADQLASLPALLGALQGTRVRVESGGRTVEGRALGVRTEDGGEANGSRSVLSVLTDAGGIASLPLGADAALTILDPEVAAKVGEAAAAAGQAHGENAKPVEIRLDGKGARDVAISYVVPAPVWKVAYRVVREADGKARLQAWAVIENATGEDWSHVAVTLASGAPVTLSQQLYRRYWRDRREIPVDSRPNLRPEADAGQQDVTAMAAEAAPAPMPAAPRSLMRFDGTAAKLSAPSVLGEAEERDLSARYPLPAPVTLAAGNTLSVPIVDAEVDARTVSLFQPALGSEHPVAALMLSNSTGASLPPGILTVYDEAGGYAGDAELLGIPAGEERMASFAVDGKVSIQSDVTPEEVISSIKVVDGVARVSVISRETTTYRIKGAADGERHVVIEHPKREGWRFRSDALDGTTDSAYRLTLDVPKGETRTVTATYELPQADAFVLTDADDAQLIRWSADAADPAVAKKLSDLAAARGEAAKAKRETDALDQRYQRLVQEQERIRQNLEVAGPDSALRQTYLDSLQRQETAIAALYAEREAATDRQAELDDRVRGIVASF